MFTLQRKLCILIKLSAKYFVKFKVFMVMAGLGLGDVDAEIKHLLRSKSSASVELPNKSALDWKVEKMLTVDPDEDRVLATQHSVCGISFYYLNFLMLFCLSLRGYILCYTVYGV